ncbi:hypothetical protein ABMA28_011436 [Loxostege sticticalis]|uniref:Peptidase aspartic putative domain-containing protein n=1 Tax=Loxostege sticticalis TaxID=481309 RepID=A0ABD0S5A1_LOXSC
MDIKVLTKQRGTIRQRLTVFENYLTPLLELKEATSVKINELRLRLNKVRELSLTFDEVQSQIEIIEEETSLQINEREATEDRFFKLISQGQTLLESFEEKHSNDSSSVSPPSNNLKLPVLQIPIFDGTPNNWLSFRDTYLSLIHNNTQIEDINKFYYLKQYLRAPASTVIESVTLSSANYKIAWSLLCERFDNKRLLINEHIKSLFAIEPLQKESQEGIHNIIDTLSKNLSALNLLGEPTNKWDALIIFMASAKLDSATARRWEEFRSDKESLNLDDFYSFLRQRATVLETINAGRSHDSHRSERRLSRSKSFISSSCDSSSVTDQCVTCKQNHKLYQCTKFKSLPIDQRIQTVSQSHLCVNCLRGGHQSYQCRLGGCKICKRKHNTLLHKPNIIQSNQNNLNPINKNNEQAKNTTQSEQNTSAINVSTSSNSATQTNPSTTITLSAVATNQALLSTALVQVINNDNIHILRAILDSGSQSSFITEKAQQLIGCNKQKHSCQHISGIGNNTFSVKEHCDLQINSLHSDFSISVRCYILPLITDSVPQLSINIQSLGIPNYINLADPQFYQPDDIDLLLGADVFWDLVGTNRLNLGFQKPILQETQLGWIVAGPIGHKYYKNCSNKISCNFSQEVREQLSRFWEIEEIPKDNKLELQDNYCEKLFAETTRRDSNGRFCVQIPLKEPWVILTI